MVAFLTEHVDLNFKMNKEQIFQVPYQISRKPNTVAFAHPLFLGHPVYWWVGGGGQKDVKGDWHLPIEAYTGLVYSIPSRLT